MNTNGTNSANLDNGTTSTKSFFQKNCGRQPTDLIRLFVPLFLRFEVLRRRCRNETIRGQHNGLKSTVAPFYADTIGTKGIKKAQTAQTAHIWIIMAQTARIWTQTTQTAQTAQSTQSAAIDFNLSYCTASFSPVSGCFPVQYCTVVF